MATVTKEPPSATDLPPIEDESLKKNTDCVYFLASPLTCKKGSECEYRHSEYARVNPRDCYYWLSGSCLNPKCAFRHPPLDGFMGPQAGNFAGPSVPAPPAPAVPTVPHVASKQAVPCIFFQQGYCLKGDRCPFSHGPNPPNTRIQQVPAITPATEPPLFKKTFGGLEKCTRSKVNVQPKASKVVEAPAQVYSIPKVETSLPRRGLPPKASIEEVPKYKETTVSPPIDSGHLRNRTARAHHTSSLDDQILQNGRDADDPLRESSPGFDVLVDDEYYQHEDQYVRPRAHDGRSLNEFEMSRQDGVDPEIYHNQRGYDSYDRLQERYSREQRRASPERSLGEPAHYDRRAPYKSGSPDVIQNSDLRQRLSKQRRNGLKSVVNPDYNRDNHAEDRGYRGTTRRDARRSPTHESSRISRLQGRIKLPRRSPPLSSGHMYSEREHHDRGRNRGRSSPNRSQVGLQQGRLRDRLSGPGRIHDDSNEGRISKGPGMRRDVFTDNGTGFAGPKSLAELKGSKPTDRKQHQLKSQQSVSGGMLRDRVLASSVGSEGDLSFDGPKPLSEILKRKRDGNNKADSDADTVNKETKTDLFSVPVQAQTAEKENKAATAEGDEEEGEISNKKVKLVEREDSVPIEEKDTEPEPEIQEGLNAAEEEEREHDEEYDQGDGEYEYEQDEGEGYDLNEGETVDNDDFMDDDDADDFAKKIGVSF